MDNVKDNAYYINKMLKDIKYLVEKTQNITIDELEENEILCDSVLFRLIQISENSNRITAAFKENHSEIPCQAIKGMRNKIVHEYGDVEIDIVFDTVTVDIPQLSVMLENLII